MGGGRWGRGKTGRRGRPAQGPSLVVPERSACEQCRCSTVCTANINHANQTDLDRHSANYDQEPHRRTYNAVCMVVAQTCECRPQVTIVRKGKCSNKQTKDTEALPLAGKDGKGTGCPCPKILKWVCGKDGVSYSNDCLAKCNGTTVAYEGRCADPGEFRRTARARVGAWSAVLRVRGACMRCTAVR